MPPALRELPADPEFRALSPGAKRIVVERLAAGDQGFRALTPEAQSIVKERLLRVQPPGLFERAGAAVAERAKLTGMGLLDAASRTGQAFVRSQAAPTLGMELHRRATTPEPVFGGPPRQPSFAEQVAFGGLSPVPIAMDLGERLIRLPASVGRAAAELGPEKAKPLTEALVTGAVALPLRPAASALATDVRALTQRPIPPQPMRALPPGPIPAPASPLEQARGIAELLRSQPELAAEVRAELERSIAARRIPPKRPFERPPVILEATPPEVPAGAGLVDEFGHPVRGPVVVERESLRERFRTPLSAERRPPVEEPPPPALAPRPPAPAPPPRPEPIEPPVLAPAAPGVPAPARVTPRQRAYAHVDVDTVNLGDPDEVLTLARNFGGVNFGPALRGEAEGIPVFFKNREGVAFDELVDMVATAQNKRPRDVEGQLLRTMERYRGLREEKQTKMRAEGPPPRPALERSPTVPDEVADFVAPEEWAAMPREQRRGVLAFAQELRAAAAEEEMAAAPRFERTAIGEQGMVPGTPGRQMPATPLRAERAQQAPGGMFEPPSPPQERLFSFVPPVPIPGPAEGEEDTLSGRLQQAAQVAGVALPFAVLMATRFRGGRSAGQRIRERVRAGAPMEQAAAAEGFAPAPSTRAMVPSRPVAGGSGPPPLTDPILSLPTHRQIVATAEELFTKAGVVRDPQRLLSDQVTELLAKGDLPLPEVKATLTRHGMSFADLANDLFRPGVTDAARRLQSLSALQLRLKSLAQTSPEAQDALRQLGEVASELDEGAKALSWWRRADNVRRGLLVTQLATAVRNFETQVGRLGLDVLQRGLDAGLQRVFRAEATTHPADGMEALLNIFRRGTKAQTEAVLRAFPREHDRLFGTYVSDIVHRAREAGTVLGGVDQAFTRAEQAVHVLNTANRFQEWAVRRAVFQGRLAERLRGQGQDLATLIQQNRVGTIDPADVRAAVDGALEMTFSKQPEWGSLGQKFVSFINALPGATLAIPFPRFLVNSLKFFWDFNPLGALRLFSPAQWKRMAAGDTEAVSRGMLGTAMFGTAWQIRNSDFAGERWFEVRLADGRTVDLRPFNPFAAYLFVADLGKRAMEGRPIADRDLLQGILSVNLRAGTGLFLVDQILSADLGKLGQTAKGVAGEAVGGLAVPLQQVTDVLAEFDESLRVVREKRQAPVTAPLFSRIPGLAQTLPEAESPTRAAPMQREAPLLRQLTGISLRQEKNPLERELDRLGFKRQEILPSTGIPEADQLIAKRMGEAAERLLVPVVASQGFARLTDAQKGEVLRRALTHVRASARRLAEREDPRLFQRLRLESLPRRQRGVLEELGVR